MNTTFILSIILAILAFFLLAFTIGYDIGANRAAIDNGVIDNVARHMNPVIIGLLGFCLFLIALFSQKKRRSTD